jgi:hypothetical protein
MEIGKFTEEMILNVTPLNNSQAIYSMKKKVLNWNLLINRR